MYMNSIECLIFNESQEYGEGIHAYFTLKRIVKGFTNT